MSDEYYSGWCEVCGGITVHKDCICINHTDYNINGLHHGTIIHESIGFGEISDGYHTFDELYAHRFALVSALAKVYGGWKSKLHHDGSMFEGGYFICGIQLPQGQISYHYKLKWWDSFPGEVLDKAPEWDGHTSDDVVDRLLEFAREE